MNCSRRRASVLATSWAAVLLVSCASSSTPPTPASLSSSRAGPAIASSDPIGNEIESLCRAAVHKLGMPQLEYDESNKSSLSNAVAALNGANKPSAPWNSKPAGTLVGRCSFSTAKGGPAITVYVDPAGDVALVDGVIP